MSQIIVNTQPNNNLSLSQATVSDKNKSCEFNLDLESARIEFERFKAVFYTFTESESGHVVNGDIHRLVEDLEGRLMLLSHGVCIPVDKH